MRYLEDKQSICEEYLSHVKSTIMPKMRAVLMDSLIPGGNASFFGLINTFVHIVMYVYYMMSAMGLQYQKYL